jgi:hypothetical protein
MRRALVNLEKVLRRDCRAAGVDPANVLHPEPEPPPPPFRGVPDCGPTVDD